jgi:hypothetical protein
MLLYEHWTEGRKKTLLIAAAVLVSRHLNTEAELIDGENYRITQLMKGATKIASGILHKIDSLYSSG